MLRLPYRSKFEISIAADLGKKKVGFEYEPSAFSYIPKVRSYTPDFYIAEKDFYIEAKGRLTTNDRVKHLMIKSQWEELDIRFIFMQASNKILKGSKTSYADWCDRHGFLWAEGTLPIEWMK
jgi:hypothetical protein|tara:strand:- start:1737 stop:2102 length:366 start_codon:yes stop_codon:yes gene_type:complete